MAGGRADAGLRDAGRGRLRRAHHHARPAKPIWGWGRSATTAPSRCRRRGQSPPIAAALGALRHAVESSVFWVLFGTFFICGASTNGLIGTHLIPACPRPRHCRGRGPPACSRSWACSISWAPPVRGGCPTGGQPLAAAWYYGLRGLSLLYLPFAASAATGCRCSPCSTGSTGSRPCRRRCASPRVRAASAPTSCSGGSLPATSSARARGVRRRLDPHAVADYLPAFFVAGALCLIAALIVLDNLAAEAGGGH